MVFASPHPPAPSPSPLRSERGRKIATAVHSRFIGIKLCLNQNLHSLYPRAAGLGAEDVPENSHILNYAPHRWLFPKMAAVVHHGGSGTTTAGF
jgi:hypothetical protein